jgi:hypothetical protein
MVSLKRFSWRKSSANFKTTLLSLPSKSALLNLSQGPASANVCHDADNTRDRQRLEQSPAVVVKEENSLHSHDASKEKTVCDRACTESLADVVQVTSKADPQAHQGWQREEHRERENKGDNLWPRFRIRLEDVVDLRLGGVALRCRWESEWSGRVAGDIEVEDVLVDGCSGAERGEDDRSAGGLRGGQELEWEVLLGLWETNVSCVLLAQSIEFVHF